MFRAARSGARSLLWALLRRGRFEDDMAGEMQFHLDAYADDLVRSGVPRHEAERRARIEFGGVEGLKESCRASRGLRLIDELRQDARYAAGLVPGTPADVSLPLAVKALDAPGFFDAHDWWLSMPLVARLGSEISEAQARAAVDATFRQYIAEPDNQWAWTEARPGLRAGTLVAAASGSAVLRRRYEQPLEVLMAMVGLVLLIACANVANLLLARSAARAKEVAVRAGIGASRGRLVRQFLTESLILACCGGGAGLLIARWGTSRVMSLLRVGESPVAIDIPLTVEIRTARDPGALAAPVRQAVRAIRKDAVVDYVRTMHQQLDASFVRERLMATLATAFGALALILACVGLYGVLSYDVTRRAREIAIRIALGAGETTVVRGILAQAAAISAAGVALGLAGAAALTPRVADFLFRLAPRDPPTFAATAAILLVTSAAAAWQPARRAASIDPIAALKAE